MYRVKCAARGIGGYRHKSLSAAHTCHMTNRAADVTLRHRRYNNSRLNAAGWIGGAFLCCYSQWQPRSVSHWHPLNHSPACLFLFMLLLYVLWMELVDVERYVLQERMEACPSAQVSVLYGLSFMVAAAGVPLELVSGLVFMLVGRALHASKWAFHLACGGTKDWPLFVLQLGPSSTLVGCKYKLQRRD